MGWRKNAIAAAALTMFVTGCGVNAGTNTSDANTAGASSASSNSAGTTNATQASTSPSVGSPSPIVGKTAPGFTLKPLNGKSNVDLKSMLKKGEPLLVNAFAAWCPPCNMEAPDLVKLAKKYKGKVQVVGVDMTPHDTVAGLKKFVKKYNINYPVLLDTKGHFENKYGVTAYPSTFAISPSGKIILFHLGYMTKQDMSAIVKKLEQSS